METAEVSFWVLMLVAALFAISGMNGNRSSAVVAAVATTAAIALVIAILITVALR